MSEIVKVEQTAEVAIFDQYFAPFRKQAQEWMDKAKTINVTDESQKGLMKQARECRLALRDVRLGIDGKHKELKEESLRKGQTLDKIRRDLVGLLEPIEQHLSEQEKFAETKELERKKKLYDERFALMHPFIGDEAKKIALGELSEDAFNAMMAGYKAAKDQKDAAAKLAKENEANTKKVAEENENLRKENLRLQAEKKEREDKEEADRQANLKAERKLKRAPDKVKIETLKEAINTMAAELWTLKDSDAQALLNEVRSRLGSIVKYIDKNLKDL